MCVSGVQKLSACACTPENFSVGGSQTGAHARTANARPPPRARPPTLAHPHVHLHLLITNVRSVPQARGTCDAKVLEYGAGVFVKLRGLVVAVFGPQNAAVAGDPTTAFLARIDAAQRFLKFEFKSHVMQVGVQVSHCSIVCVGHVHAVVEPDGCLCVWRLARRWRATLSRARPAPPTTQGTPCVEVLPQRSPPRLALPASPRSPSCCRRSGPSNGRRARAARGRS